MNANLIGILTSLRWFWVQLVLLAATMLAYPVLSVALYVSQNQGADAWVGQLLGLTPVSDVAPYLLGPDVTWRDVAIMAWALAIATIPRGWYRLRRDLGVNAPSALLERYSIMAVLAYPYITMAHPTPIGHVHLPYIGLGHGPGALQALLCGALLVAASITSYPPRNEPNDDPRRRHPPHSTR